MALTYHDKLFVTCAAVLALGMVGGGYLLGDGLKRAKAADRSVTVRGLAEKDVTADLATWSISYSATGFDLPGVRAEIDNNRQELQAYFASLGFRPDALTTTGAGRHDRRLLPRLGSIDIRPMGACKRHFFASRRAVS